jgi:hypothetical protein
MVPQKQDYLIMLIDKHDTTAGCYVRISFRFLLIFEAHRWRNTLPLIIIGEQLLRSSVIGVLPLLEVSRITQNLRARHSHRTMSPKLWGLKLVKSLRV